MGGLWLLVGTSHSKAQTTTQQAPSDRVVMLKKVGSVPTETPSSLSADRLFLCRTLLLWQKAAAPTRKNLSFLKMMTPN